MFSGVHSHLGAPLVPRLPSDAIAAFPDLGPVALRLISNLGSCPVAVDFNTVAMARQPSSQGRARVRPFAGARPETPSDTPPRAPAHDSRIACMPRLVITGSRLRARSVIHVAWLHLEFIPSGGQFLPTKYPQIRPK